MTQVMFGWAGNLQGDNKSCAGGGFVLEDFRRIINNIFTKTAKICKLT